MSAFPYILIGILSGLTLWVVGCLAYEKGAIGWLRNLMVAGINKATEHKRVLMVVCAVVVAVIITANYGHYSHLESAVAAVTSCFQTLTEWIVWGAVPLTLTLIVMAVPVIIYLSLKAKTKLEGIDGDLRTALKGGAVCALVLAAGGFLYYVEYGAKARAHAPVSRTVDIGALPTELQPRQVTLESREWYRINVVPGRAVVIQSTRTIEYRGDGTGPILSTEEGKYPDHGARWSQFIDVRPAPGKEGVVVEWFYN